MRKRPTARYVNGILAIVIVAFFAVHGALGAASGFFPLTRTFAWLVWVGIAIVCVHIVASIVTSRQQLTDREHPPSTRKKRHLALKWVTGVVLAAAVIAHIVVMRTTGETLTGAGIGGLVGLIALIALLAAHTCIGVRSLLKDIGADRERKTAARIAVCTVAAAIAIACIAAVL